MNKQNVIDVLRNAKERKVTVKLCLNNSPEQELSMRIISLDDKGNVEGESAENSFFIFNIEDVVSNIGICPVNISS